MIRNQDSLYSTVQHGLHTSFNGIAYGVPQAAEAKVASSVGFVVGEFVGSVLPVIIAPFWLFAVYLYLVNLTGRRTLTAGVVLCLLGAGVTLPGLGVINYAFPALADAYLALKRAGRL